MKNTAANCPVSGVKVNEGVVRAVALLVIIFALAAIWWQSFTICFLLAVDFALRAFTKGEHSLLRIAGLSVSKLLRLQNKEVDVAPKKFAAALGFVFSLSAGIFLVFNASVLSTCILIILIVCAFLECIFSICLGCIVYGWFQKIALKKPV